MLVSAAPGDNCNGDGPELAAYHTRSTTGRATPRPAGSRVRLDTRAATSLVPIAARAAGRGLPWLGLLAVSVSAAYG